VTELVAAQRTETASYRRILSSSALIGGSSLITVAAAIVRTKFVAILLGPGGLGVMGILTSMTTLVGTLTGMGITTAGVRRIAETAGTADDQQVTRTTVAVRMIMLRLGLIGGVSVALFSMPISRLTFGTSAYTTDIALLSVVVVVGAVSDGYLVILQGLRRMGDLAQVAIAGAVISLVLSVPIAYVWRQSAVVALLIAAAAATLVSAWWYARRVEMAPVTLTWNETFEELKPLIGIGLVSMNAALMVAGMAYVVRLMIVRRLGVEAAGMYQSATALSGVYCGFILGAMGADLLPRLASVASSDAECNRLVNEQAEVGLLLALPGVCGTLTFAPLIIHTLYSSQFALATDVLRWQVLGIFLRVASWPMGYLLIAKGEARIYLWSEISYNAIHAALIWICVRLWGLEGTGIAFFGLYIYYLLMMSVLVRRVSGFTWSIHNRHLVTVAVPIMAVVFMSRVMLPSPWDVTVAAITTVFVGLYSLRTLVALVEREGPGGPFDLQRRFIRMARQRVAALMK
jgi:O-antigen/teichoic acid export membrane protein